MIINNVNYKGKTVNVVADKGVIVSVGKRTRKAGASDTVIDGTALTLMPAFIDMHVHFNTTTVFFSRIMMSLFKLM